MLKGDMNCKKCKASKLKLQNCRRTEIKDRVEL